MKLGQAAAGPNGETLDELALKRYPEVKQIQHVHHAGNSSGIVDGAAAVLFASADYVKRTLGIAHQFRSSDHYGPFPSQWFIMDDWSPVYYNKADSAGLGFDRSVTGSNFVAQYFPTLEQRYGDIDTTPENLLMWFHHVPWGHRMSSGRPFWDVFIAPEERDEVVARFRALAPDFEAGEYENAFTNARGERRVIFWRSAPVHNDAGVVTGIIVVVAFAIRREDRRYSLVREAPDRISRSARRLTGLGRRGLDAEFFPVTLELVH